MDRLHFCIHGAGGLGSVVGGFLARDGHRVTLIARPAHVAAIKAEGLHVDGIRATFTVKDIAAVTIPEDVIGPIDYYIILTKSKGTAQALADAECLVERTTSALSLQNGVGKERLLREYFGHERVMGGSIMEGATLLSPGHALNHMAVPITAYFGEIGGGESARSRVIADAFTRAGLGSKSTPDIEHVLWEKLIQVGGASAWGASTLGGIPKLDFVDGVTIREGAEHFVTINKEMIAIYRALGYAPQNFFAPVSRLKEFEAEDFETAVEAAIAIGQRFVAKTRPVRTSMHDDLVAGRKMEVDEILGPLVDAAKRLNVQAPTVMAAYRVLSTLNKFL